MPPFRPAEAGLHLAASIRLGICRSPSCPRVSLPRSYAWSRVKPISVRFVLSRYSSSIPRTQQAPRAQLEFIRRVSIPQGSGRTIHAHIAHSGGRGYLGCCNSPLEQHPQGGPPSRAEEHRASDSRIRCAEHRCSCIEGRLQGFVFCAARVWFAWSASEYVVQDGSWLKMNGPLVGL